ncbi:MAG: ribonucleoside triphosphate reductase [Candidatus Helarchaeota archaeon]
MDDKVETGQVQEIEIIKKEKLELIPTMRTVHVDLENFDNMIESQIKKYLHDSFTQNDNANTRKSFSGLVNSVSQYDFKRNALKDLYKHAPDAVKAHEVGLIHIHDLWTSRFCGYCSGWDLRQIIRDGLDLVVSAKPAKHLQTILNHMINFIVTAQREWAGALAFSDVDVLLAPFVRNDHLTYKQVKQHIQNFVFNLNFPTRYGDQPPFVNITLDLTLPKRYEGVPALLAGKEQSFTYDQLKKEMFLINKAFFEVINEGDAKGNPFTFPIPTIALDKNFEYDTEIGKLLMELTAKKGSPYFLNYNVDYLEPESNLSMCCRLRIDYTEIEKHSGGLWAIGENTGSIGVVSLNMPRIGFLSKKNGNLFDNIDKVLEMARKQLKHKRRVINESLKNGLLPTTQRTLCAGFQNHFNTIGVVGFHDFCMNYIGQPIYSLAGRALTKKVLRYIREKIAEFQREDKMLYNLEQTPAEKTAGRFAFHDYKDFGDAAYYSVNNDGILEYTNSTHLPVDYNGIIDKIKIEGEFHREFTGGCITHLFMDEISNVEGLTKFIKRTAEHSDLSYFSITPTLSVCDNCRKTLVGNFPECPICNGETIIWSRVTGYYRPVQRWNPAKRAEFKLRTTYHL